LLDLRCDFEATGSKPVAPNSLTSSSKLKLVAHFQFEQTRATNSAISIQNANAGFVAW
jgi:hypothetical protein